jgi:enoyl-CoA hydratase
VITGAGRAFSSGGDFGGGTTGEPDPDAPVYVNDMQEARMIVDNMLDCEKPIISAVNGYAMGLGATVALLADVVVAGRSAIFADTHIKMGISAGDGGQVIWPQLIGPSRAKYYLMTGDRISGEEAERIGLATFCVDDDQLMPRALEIAGRLAAGPTYAINASKVAVNKYLKFISNMVLPISLAMEEVSMTKEDHREAVSAFQQKRDPKFTGR